MLLTRCPMCGTDWGDVDWAVTSHDTDLDRVAVYYHTCRTCWSSIRITITTERVINTTSAAYRMAEDAH